MLDELLALDPENRLEYLLKKDSNGDTPLHSLVKDTDNIAQNTKILEGILQALPDDETRLAALKEHDREGKPVIHIASRIPEYFSEIRYSFSRDNFLKLAKFEDRNKWTLLHQTAADASLSQKAVNPDKIPGKRYEPPVYAVYDVLGSYPTDDIYNPTLEMLKQQKERLEALRKKDTENNTVLHLAAKNPEVLDGIKEAGGSIWNEVTRDGVAETILFEQNSDGNTVAHLAAENSSSLEWIFNLFREYAPNNPVPHELLNTANKKGDTILTIAYQNDNFGVIERALEGAILQINARLESRQLDGNEKENLKSSKKGLEIALESAQEFLMSKKQQVSQPNVPPQTPEPAPEPVSPPSPSARKLSDLDIYAIARVNERLEELENERSNRIKEIKKENLRTFVENIRQHGVESALDSLEKSNNYQFVIKGNYSKTHRLIKELTKLTKNEPINPLGVTRELTGTEKAAIFRIKHQILLLRSEKNSHKKTVKSSGLHDLINDIRKDGLVQALEKIDKHSNKAIINSGFFSRTKSLIKQLKEQASKPDDDNKTKFGFKV